ncbi:MAG: aldehyde ferredoxin oxidoreductase family protein [Promethearchaeota archaeon]
MNQKLLGYNGKILFINLEKDSVEIKDLDPQIAEDYLGGTGLSAKLTFDLLTKEDYNILKENPLSEINPLIFATGPITGTIRPSSGRYSVSGISPLTRIWGEGTSGGFFCISLRNCGYDAIVITGKSKTPNYLYINDGNVEFKDASYLWGEDCYETQKLIREDLKDSKVNIACIGLAGENLVKYAAIINDEGRAIGRCGLGTIMGSKKLKALAITGGKRVQIADNRSGKEIRRNAELAARKNLFKSLTPQMYDLYGTDQYLDIGMIQGDTPGYYFTVSEFLAEKLTAKTIKEEYPVFSYSCAGCTMKCGKETIIKKEGKEIRVDGPEYESVAAFGPLCGVFDSKPVILSHHLCNIYGIDTISGGVCISFLMYLVENDIGLEKIKNYLKDITLEEIKWGNGYLILKLLEKIAIRDGVGDLLARGVREMAEKLEIDQELAANVKGLEIPMHDPRAFAGQALSYMTCCVGANHEKGDWYSVELGTLQHSGLRIKTGRGRDNIKGREKGVMNLQDLRAIDDSAVNCNFVSVELNDLIAYINAGTGFNYDKKSLLRVGERINNIKRVINCNMGITRQDDRLPKHITQVLTSGRIAGVKLDLEENLKRYYKERNWDWETGRPKEEKLKELEIIK